MDRQVADFWARLASVKKLDDLRESERLHLLEDMQQLCFPWFDDPAAVDEFITSLPARYQDKPRKAQAENCLKAEYLPYLLMEMHRDAIRLIADIRLGEVDISVTTVWSIAPGGRLHEEVRDFGKNNDFSSTLLSRQRNALIQFIRDHKRRFPFVPCDWCMRIFVPVRRQRFCSPNCAYLSLEHKRKGKKRDYMRTYMAKRRTKAKSPQKRKETP